MKRVFYLFLILLFPIYGFSQISFDEYFHDKTFRFDYLLGGNHNELTVFPQEMKEEGVWSGNKNSLIDELDYGAMRFYIVDKASGQKIFSKGFSPLFLEWQSTAEAKELSRTAYQALHFPFPKKAFSIEIAKRSYEGVFESVFHHEVDPSSYFIRKEKSETYPVVQIIESGNYAEKVDLVILAEGYTVDEMNKFEKDAKRLTEKLFQKEPFKSNRNSFNVHAIQSPSVESGTDVPGESIYKNTRFNSSFYTFDIDRYLTTSDMKSIYDVAALVPWDHVYVLVNTERYGGGGFYNFLNLATSDNQLAEEVFIHEFGHGFAGLADEYYTSEVAYEDYYNPTVEPWEPNITTMVDFESKWKDMIDDKTPVPTPRTEEYENVVGSFEGGGYMAKEMFSPVQDCRMKSNKPEGFCPVCKRAIQRVIETYTK